MNLSMAEILKLDCLKNGELLVKGDNFEEPVSGITIMEAPDIAKWVKKGQIILTSLYSIAQNEGSIEQLVKDLKACEIGGIIVKTRYSEEIYEHLLRSCEKYKLNLIKIPPSEAYSEILQEVMGCLFSYQLKRANYFKACHDAFMKIALAGEGVEKIIKTLTEMVKSVIVAYDTNGKLLATNLYMTSGEANIGFEDKGIRAEGENLEYFYRTISVNGAKISGVAIPFKALSRISGYIFIKTEIGRSFNEYEWIAIENAVNVLNLEVTKQLAVAEIEQRFKNDLLSDLLTGNIQSESIILRRSDTMGWDMSKHYMAVVIKLTMPSEIRTKGDMAAVMRNIQDILKRGMEGIQTEYGQSIIGTANDTFTVLWAYDKKKNYSKNAESVRLIIENMYEACKERYGIQGFSAGIGHETDSIYDISKSYDEAVNAMKYGHIIYGENKICDFNGLGIYRLITKLNSREELMEFVPPSLKKLIDYDNASKNVLVHTLDVYLSCDCNLGKAASLLFIHYKTLVYRIGRIKEIMDVDNLEGDIRLELQLALKIMKIMSNGQEREDDII